MKKILLIQLFILIAISIFSQTLEPPVNATINSDYGPRMLTNYDWHKGIDYLCNAGTYIEAVEGGNITEIDYQEPGTNNITAGYYTSIQGTNSRWTYMHLFSDNTNPQSGDWEARMATLENPDNSLQCVNTYIFINWNNRNNNIANTVLTPYMVGNQIINHWYVRARSTDPGYNPANPYIFSGNVDEDENNIPILTQGSVANREIIGPSGNSGEVGPHLHVSCSDEVDYDYIINPLYHIIHTEPAYTINILNPLTDDYLYHMANAQMVDLDSTLQTQERVKNSILYACFWHLVC